MAMPLARIIIFVGDVEKCVRFYCEAFGFTAIASEHPSSEWVELETGGCRLAFHKAHGPDGPIDSPTGSANNPHKIVFFTEDVASAKAQLEGRGASMGEIRRSGTLVLCDGRDPEGHVFQISNRA